MYKKTHVFLMSSFLIKNVMKSLIFSFFMLTCSLAFSQHVSLRGSVSDGKTPLPEARIVVEGQEQHTVSDFRGEFELLLPKGLYTLEVTAKGYLTKKMPVELLSAMELPTIVLEKENHTQAAQQMGNTISISDEQLDDEEGSPEMISGFLQSSQDLYFRRAAYDFSSVFYRPRGYQSNAATVLVNGVTMNKVETGRPQWSNWGGLNDATRGQVITTGVGASESDFGGVFGNTSYTIAPSELRNGLRITGTATNRNYFGRGMVTYNTGTLPSGWGYMVSASYRGGNGKTFLVPNTEGLVYQSYGASAAVEYKASPYFSTNLMGIFSYNNRGKSAPLTQETIALGGRNYNPNWGYQAGELRNSKMKRIAEPLFVLSNTYHKGNTKIAAHLGYQFGQVGDTRIQYVKSQNPDPSYYTNMPTYFYNMYDEQTGEGDPFAHHKAAQQIAYFRTHKQLDWDRLYLANSLTGGESMFALNEDIIDTRTLTANVLGTTKITPNITFNGGISYQHIGTENYQQINDLLGGKYFLNKSYYSGENYDTAENLRLGVGDKYQYYYKTRTQRAHVFGQLRFKYGRADFYVAGRVAHTDYEREGMFANNSVYTDSKGMSGQRYFNTISTKAGLTYSITGRHILQFNTGYFEEAQPLNNVYVNIRNSNSILPARIHPENQITWDGSYIIRIPSFKARITGYATQIKHSSEKSYFFTQSRLGDESAGFLTQTMIDAEKLHFGMELGAEYDLTASWKASAVVSLNQYTYTNNPLLFQSSDKRLVSEPIVSYLKDYHAGQAPEHVYSLGIEYQSPRYWWVALTANYFDKNYIGIAPSLRTENIYLDPNTGSRYTDIDENTVRGLLRQEQLPGLFLLNATAGKSWRIKGNFLNVFASVNNLLNTQYKSNGFEQARKGDYQAMIKDRKSGYPTFGNKYFTGYGTSFYLNVTLSL